MLSLLPALKATRARLQSHLANRGAGGATLRFGRVWTGAMIVQVALTAIGIPVATGGPRARRCTTLNIRAAFPSREYLAARIDVDRPFDEETTPAFEERRARTFAALERRIAQEPGVVAVTFADRAPGSGARSRSGQVETSAGADAGVRRSVRDVGGGPGILRDIRSSDRRRACVPRGRPESGCRERSSSTRRSCAGFQRSAGRGSPIGARLRYSASPARAGAAEAEPSAAADASADRWFEIVGVVRDLGLDPDDLGDEPPFVFHAASAGTVSPLVMSVRVRGNPAASPRVCRSLRPMSMPGCSSGRRGRWTTGSGSGTEA